MANINGNNTIFATLNGIEFFIDKALEAAPPVYGYTVTQAAYDQLTPETNMYYAIINTAAGEEITAVLELTQAQYDGMSTHVAATLYIITGDSDISDVFVGDTELTKLYLGSEEIWSGGIIPPAPVIPYIEVAKNYFDQNAVKFPYYVMFGYSESDFYRFFCYAVNDVNFRIDLKSPTMAFPNSVPSDNQCVCNVNANGSIGYTTKRTAPNYPTQYFSGFNLNTASYIESVGMYVFIGDTPCAEP